MSRGWSALVFLVSFLFCTTHALAAPRRFALVVGANAPQGKDLDPLEFADDDAVRNYELLRSAGFEATLVTSPDSSTQTAYRSQLPAFEQATLGGLKAAVAKVLAEVQAAHDAGQRTELYFWFAGHGGVSGTEFALFLEDGDFTQNDIKDMLDRSSADFNNVLIDACHASSLVTGRGATSDLEARLQAVANAALPVPFHQWKNHRRTGWVLARGADAKTYEWSEYQAGVVSHEVRSALSGGADVKKDSRVSYPELDSFVNAANTRVQATARPRVLVRPPPDDNLHTLVDWSAARPTTLKMGVDSTGHLFVRDATGARLVEVNKARGDTLSLVLMPRDRYHVTFEKRELPALVVAAGAAIELEAVLGARVRGGTQQRGAFVDEAFRNGLFAQAFGREFFLGYCAPRPDGCEPLPAMVDEPGEVPPVRDEGEHQAHATRGRFGVAPYVLVGGAGVAGAAAIGFFFASEATYEKYKAAPPAEKGTWEDKTRTLDWATTISLSVAGAAAATGVGLWLWDRYAAPDVTVVAGPGAISVTTAF